MRELERNFLNLHPPTPVALTRVGVVGKGRLGPAIAAALRDAGYQVGEPAGRGEVPAGAEAILLCVPDAEIPAAAEAMAGRAPLVGHTSGATPLTALEPARRAGAEVFGLHPLQTVTGEDTRFTGCGCAVAGSSPGALLAAARIATELGMASFTVEDSQRAAYHAAASISSNFLVTLQADAERLAASAGISGFEARAMLGQLVRTTVENWIELGPERALTGPVARGDQGTVDAQREAIASRCPELEPMFDALVERTEALATRSSATAALAPGTPARASA